jgi:hypothetical protein
VRCLRGRAPRPRKSGVVVQDSKVLKDVNPDQPIRFQPLTKEGWRETFLVAPVDFCGVVPFGRSRNH